MIDSREAGPGRAVRRPARAAAPTAARSRAQALAAGAWGVLVAPEHAEAAAAQRGRGVVLARRRSARARSSALATAWRRELGAKVIGVTGSTGKTSTKDLLLAVLAPHRRTVASRANFNTEIGLPLEILRRPAGTEVLVLEMAMRGAGQIAELAAIAEPDVGVIVSVGPVHLELLGTIEAIAAAKAELIAALRAGRHGGRPGGRAAARAPPARRPRARSPSATAATCGCSSADRERRRDRPRRASGSTLEVDVRAGAPAPQPAGRGRRRERRRRHARRAASSWRCRPGAGERVGARPAG